MLFNNAMCIICRGKVHKPKMRAGGIGICPDCLAALPETDATMSFAALKNLDYIISPFYYKDAFRDAVIDYKFRGCRAYADVFNILLREYLGKLSHLKDFDVIVPVPLSKRRMNERGYNQASLLAKPLAEFLGIDYSEDILARVRNTKRQSAARGYERAVNVKDAFSAAADIAGKNVIVFDDICTTGYTLDECAKALKSAGANKIIGITLAIVYQKHLNRETRLF